VRLRDHGKPCVSCGSQPELTMGSGGRDAGHYRSRGAVSHLRFNLFNIHAQCINCNRFKSGNVQFYRLGLIKKIGLERVERLESDNVPRKFTIDYLVRIKSIFQRRERNLQKLRQC
jgi:hypothetical protein